MFILREFETCKQRSGRGWKLKKIARVLGFDGRYDMLSKQDYEERVAENQGICLICGLVHYDVPRLRKSQCRDCRQLEVLHIGQHPSYAVHRRT